MALYRSYSRSSVSESRPRSGSVVKRSSSFIGSIPLGRSSSRVFFSPSLPTRTSYSPAYTPSSYTPSRSSSTTYYSERFPHVRYSHPSPQPSLPVYTSFSRPSRFLEFHSQRSASSNNTYTSPSRSASFGGSITSRNSNIDNVIGLYTRSHMTANTLSKYFLSSGHHNRDYSAYQYHPVVETPRNPRRSSSYRVRF